MAGSSMRLMKIMGSYPKEVGEAGCLWVWAGIGIVCHSSANSFR